MKPRHLSLLFLLLAVAPLSAADRPNIVFFVADDLGQRDLGSYGSTFYETPHLDRLAAEGMRFTDAYAACPVCSPTRAALVTGQWPQRTGITDYIGAPLTPDQWKRNTKLLPAPYADRLALEEVTFAEVLKEAGYATFFAGKWHLGPEGWWPENQGFDVNQGGIDRGGPYGGKKYFSPYGNPRLEDGPEGEHLPDRLAAEAGKFIEANRERPFLVYYPFYDVHTPLMGREDLVKKYEEKKNRLGLEEKWGREGERDVRLRPGARGLRGHGRGDGPGRGAGDGKTRRTRSRRKHPCPLYERQRRSFHQRGFPHLEPAMARWQRLDV